MDKNNNSLEKLKVLLRELFQFDDSDLDFGIYRIMNFKRKEIQEFIDKQLVSIAEKEFEKYKTQGFKELSEKAEAKKKEIRKLEEQIGEKILKNDDFNEDALKYPIVKEYAELKKQLGEIEVAESVKAQVYNDLYNFLSRYYEDGDFISKRRYSSKHERYAIPYNGEEVKLYWANFDQYYIKTGEVFKDYEFVSKSWRFVFRTVFAQVEAGNVKGERRLFILSKDDPIDIDKTHKACVVKFVYTPVTEEVSKEYKAVTKGGEEKKTGIKQEDINSLLEQKILSAVKEAEAKALLSSKKDDKSLLSRQLYKYSRKITSDFFIHKNLKGFLEGELGYFIKTEVVDTGSLDDKNITRAKVVEGIGKQVVEFLSQIEEFQKMLWEKKKFVLKTDYVISLDRLPEELHKEILENKAQCKEWSELGFGKIGKKSDLYLQDDLVSREYKKLPVDTKYFSVDFKERLLEKISEKKALDDLIDGVLIKSENWQALNLLRNKYKEQIQCIYIDPPFNTGDDFLYKDSYRNSSWLSLIDNRLMYINILLKAEGAFYLHLDENANFYGRILVNNMNFSNIQEISFNTNATKDDESDLYGYKSFGKRFVLKHNTIFYSFNDRIYFNKLWKPNRNTSKLNLGWLDLLSEPIVANPQKIEDCKFYIESYDNRGNFTKKYIKINEKIFPLGDMWTDIYSFTQSEMRVSENISFLTQKPENLLRRIIQSSSQKGDIVLDFFAGSGTTLTVAQKLSRKWVGIEMGDYYNEFYIDKGIKKLGIMGRLKNVLYGDKKFKAVDKERRSHLSDDLNWAGGGFYKYCSIEQYEDTLHNIDFIQAEKGRKAKELFTDDEYLLKYFLQYETSGSPSLLNIKAFDNPFEYKLRVISNANEEESVSVDIVETFNYLLGLKVSRYRFLKDGSIKYVLVLGEQNRRKTAIIWRETKGIDLDKDRKFIEGLIADYKPDEILINGDACVKGYKVIEREFKTLMGV